MPIFGCIIDILIFNTHIYLATQVYTTYTFNQHYHAYEVVPTTTVHICTVESLQDYHPLTVYQSYDERLISTFFIPLKYYVLSDID